MKKLRYRRAKVKVTASCISMMTASSSLSTLDVWANLMFPANSDAHKFKKGKMFYEKSAI